MNKKQQGEKSVFSKWIEFIGTSFVLSILPFGLLFCLSLLFDFRIEEHEYIPDLIMVSFAVCVNIFNISLGGMKKGKIEILSFWYCIICMLGCVAIYFYAMGVMTELNIQIEKFSIVYNESPETLIEFANELNKFLENRINKIQWKWMFLISIVIMIISVFFGTIMVIKTYYSEKNKEENRKKYFTKKRMSLNKLSEYINEIKCISNSNKSQEIIDILNKMEWEIKEIITANHDLESDIEISFEETDGDKSEN